MLICTENEGMSYFVDHLNAQFTDTGLTPYKAALEGRIDGSLMHRVLKGERPPSENFLKGLASVPSLGVSFETLEAWHILDHHNPAAIREAARLLDEEGV